jgi:hypothetical protein
MEQGMTELGKPLEEPLIEILPAEDPVPSREPVPVGPAEDDQDE